MDQEFIFAKKVALQAGEVILKYFDSNVRQREKEDQTIVTIADEMINDLVIKEVKRAYPDHAVFGEEGSSGKNIEYTWVCDPIDGTLLYSKGLPIPVFSMALVQDGRPTLGVVYDPFTKRMYSALKDKGAYLNDRLIKVNKNKLMRGSVINVEWWSDAEYDLEVPLHALALRTNCYVLHLGSVIAASCLVASGKYEAGVFAGTTGKAVDIAAVKIIVEEAGGKVTDLFGKEQRYDGDIKGAIISNGVVHEELLSALNLT